MVRAAPEEAAMRHHWTAREQASAVSAAASGMGPALVRLHLHKLGYPLRSKAAVGLRLRALGIVSAVSTPWTATEDGILRGCYERGEPLRVEGRSRAAIRGRAELLGLQGSHPKPRGWAGEPWSEVQIARLRALYPTMAGQDVAAVMGRSLHAVQVKAQSLGIPAMTAGRAWSADELRAIRIAHAYGISITDLAAALDRDQSVISRQARRRMNLRFNRRINRAPRTSLAARTPWTLDGILALSGGVGFGATGTAIRRAA